MTFFFLSQILAALAFVSDVASFQFKQRKHILLCLLFSTVLLTLHFCLLQSYLSAGVVFLSMVRIFIAYFRTDRWLIYFFSIVTALFFVWIHDFSLSGFLALVAGIFFSVAAFQKTDQYLRIFTFCGMVFWIPHVVFVGSPMGVFVECFFLLSNLVGYFRYYLRKSS